MPNAEITMKTLILVNMNALTEANPQEALGIQHAVETLACEHNAEVLDIDQTYREKTGRHITTTAYPSSALTAMAREIKAEVLSQTGGQLDSLILVGDESAIPMWEVGLGQRRLHTDSFYADLDGDGLPEVVTTRVLGNPEAMRRQLSETAQIGGPEATILCSEDTRIHLETQRFLDALVQQGHRVTVMGRGGEERLPQSDLIIHFGHGNPQRLSNRFGEDYVTAEGMPALPHHPIAIVDGCATTPPGSKLLRAFLNNGCRAYLGSSAGVMGMIPARYTNQLVMHFLDAYQVHPDWPVAKLLTFARAKYASVALLSEVLLELERAETLPVEGDMGVHLMTFLEWHAFGSPFARLHQGDARPVFVKRPLVEAEASLQAQAQNVVEATFDLASSDGQPILFLQADWLNSVSSSLVLRIQQNGQTIHELRGDARITYRELFNYQRIEDICVGGYVDGDLYHAYWLLPLRREVGQNCLRTELVSPDAEVSVLPESAIEIWPEWETISPPAEK
jgi:hypothetical protein